MNTVFVNSCDVEMTVKELPSIGYVHDIGLPGVSHTVEKTGLNGMMIVSSGITRIENDRLKEPLVSGFQNTGFNRVTYSSSTTAWGVGSDGALAVSRDGGLNWELTKIDTKMDLKEIVFSNDLNGWILAADYKNGLVSESAVFRTVNGGRSWIRVIDGPEATIDSVIFTDQDHGFAITDKGGLISTSDSGQTWSQLDPAFGRVEHAAFVDRDIGFVISEEALWRTADGGKKWSSLGTFLPLKSNDIKEIIFTNKRLGWILSWDNVWKTSDGGSTWKRLELDDRFTERTLK